MTSTTRPTAGDWRCTWGAAREMLWRLRNDPTARVCTYHVGGAVWLRTHETIEDEHHVRHWTLPNGATLGVFVRGVLLAWGTRADLPRLVDQATRLLASERLLPRRASAARVEWSEE